MSGPIHRRATNPWRFPIILALLVLIGFGTYSAGRSLWAEYHLRAARQALERREFVAAREHLARCLQVWPRNAEVCLLAAQAARRARDYREASRLLTTYRELGGVPEAVRLERALANAQRGQLKEVEGSLWAAVRNDPADAPLVLEALAQGYMETFRWSEALGCLGQLLESHPDDTEVLTWRGWVLENLHRTAEARADYQKAVELAPEHVEARLRLGEALLQTNLPGEALMHFEHVRERQPDNPTMLLGLVRCLQLLNRLEEARRVLDRLLLQKPVPAPVLTEKGKLALSLGETAEAEKWLRQSFALAPHDRDTNFQLYRCLEQSGKEEEAKAFFATFQRIERDQDRLQDLFREMQKKPRDLSLRAEAGLILLRNGQTPEGIRLLEGVLQEDPRHKSAHQALADYYQSQGYNDRAMQHRRAAEESR